MASLKTKVAGNQGVVIEQSIVESEYLERGVTIDAYFPAKLSLKMDLLLINDGQDLPKMPFDQILGGLYKSASIKPLLCIGIHCGIARHMEYGTVCQADYEGKGTKAGLYEKFIFEELLPFIENRYGFITFKNKSFAGFSLGGLSALDLVWNHAAEFTKAGVFSGSLWWRRRGYSDGYKDDKDRIMHLQVKKGKFQEGLKFFFQCGQLDEKADRNCNGIIDSIEDALDLIKELKRKGYTEDDIRYLELVDGKHDIPTWGRAFPEFLKWGWGK